MVFVSTSTLDERYPLNPGWHFDHSEYTIWCQKLIVEGGEVEGAVVDIYYNYGDRYFGRLNDSFLILTSISIVVNASLLLIGSGAKRGRGKASGS